jgi:branched-chain amino acid transport system permease protein
MGIDVVAAKNMAFLASALIAGLAGAFYAHTVGSLDAGDFKFGRAVDILGYAVLGGSGAWFGPLLGAGLLTALPILIRDGLGSSFGFLKDFAQLPNILSGLALMIAIIFAPGGLAALFSRPASREGERPAAGAGNAQSRSSGTLDTAPNAVHGPLLRISRLSRSFGGLKALSEVDLEIEQGKIYGLIGPNGAGKTTLINLLSGLDAPSSGKIEWLGREIQGRSAWRIARSGLARSYQHAQLFGEMSVLENVAVGLHARLRSSLVGAWLRLPSFRREEAEAMAEALELLGALGLAELAGESAEALSYGDRRRVEIARALATGPRLLLLDEPAAGMNEVETAALGRFILGLKERGLAILIVEHHMDLIMGVCDEILVLDFGRAIARGSPAEVSRERAVLDAYLGSDS